mmetsp:Transcript_91914/g.297304  ORF Transcript_91914/g.297304 Transcript_91914/m.297304 type:complete len:298 (-) Transcript_91914:37-930(-)
MATRAEALQKLREDWLAENSDDREEGVTRWQLNNQIAQAKLKTQKAPEDMDRLLDLAEAYGVLEPTDKRGLNVCERLMGQGGVNTLDTQRQGEAYQLFGRCLFLADKHEESLTALQRAAICFREKGNFSLRRRNNRALLRVFCALGRGREASERLEVALTLCENSDDCIMLYISAKQALEHTTCDRDKEILDDIWYVYLDTHPEEKVKFEQYNDTGIGLCRQFAGGEERTEEAPVDWNEVWQRVKDPEVWKDILPAAVEECKTNPYLRGLLMLAGYLLLLYIILIIMVTFKGEKAAK